MGALNPLIARGHRGFKIRPDLIILEPPLIKQMSGFLAGQLADQVAI